MTIVQMNMKLTNHFLSFSGHQISAHLVWAQIKHHFKNKRKGWTARRSLTHQHSTL